ncbi:MAG TPA: 2-oxoacid:acceptor oxidoreductase subunit alpha [Bacteroidales bacterium]|nr:2-oxoacid:acceptor oxidoreductase subunit alpha [Bacteroidales bacterium]
MSKVKNTLELESAVVKFVGDSGDGMQLIGTLFADTTAYDGNDLTTFPDYPAEIRPPQNTIAGVSGFQVHFGSKKILTFGEKLDLLVALNPASLKSNLKWTKKDTIILVDSDAFDEGALEKSGYSSNPLTDGSLKDRKLIAVPVTTLIKEKTASLGVDNKTALRSRNMLMLGLTLRIFSKKTDYCERYIDKKFGNKGNVAELNKMVVKLGYEYLDQVNGEQYSLYVAPAKLEKGKYRNIHGNTATAWGLMAAAERANMQLYLGSYPITPATEILMELAKHKSLGVKVVQAEDEIAGITSAIGASFAGAMAATTTSGPGLSLKSEALGLAVITELPLVVVNVQRGGPSTGLPTKSEQADLVQALYGRNGEAPMLVMAADSPADCFYSAFMAAKLSVEHMTPCILLTDGSLGNGSELFKIPEMNSLPTIKPPYAQPNTKYQPYERNPETLARYWAVPGTEGLRHRIGGLEKENVTGIVSTDPDNHELMVKLRAEKVQRIANYIPEQEVFGEAEGDLLVVSWGGTKGVVRSSVIEMQKEGKKVSHAHFRYIMPLPKNTEHIFSKFKKIIVCELNSGQFVGYLRATLPQFNYYQANKVQSLPFFIDELKEKYFKLLED